VADPDPQIFPLQPRRRQFAQPTICTSLAI
jgi:hypothetical protein